MNKILVTGARGFLGQAVLRQLSLRGYRNVLAPSHEELNLMSHGAVMDYIYGEEPDTVIHLAAKVGGIAANIASPADFIRDNLVMGLNVLQTCVAAKTNQLCIIGTSCSYPRETPCPMEETELFNGLPTPETGYYGIAKRTLFVAAEAYRKQYGLRSILLLPTNLYGPGDKSSHVVSDLIRKFKMTPTGVLKVWGTGRATRDFLYVDDCAAGIIKACESEPFPTVPVNLGSGIETPISELADRIRRLTFSHAEIVWDHTKPEGQPRRVLSVARARNWLNWSPITSLEDGLQKTIEAYDTERRNGPAV